MRETSRILRRIHEELLLLAKFLRLAIRNQRVGDIAERVLNGLLIEKQALLLPGFGEVEIRPQLHTSEDWLCQSCTKTPDSRRPSEQVRQRRALVSRACRERVL